MRVSYDRLWKLMKNNKMTKRDLAQAAGFSQYMMGQFTRAEYVSLKAFLMAHMKRLSSYLTMVQVDWPFYMKQKISGAWPHLGNTLEDAAQ